MAAEQQRLIMTESKILVPVDFEAASDRALVIAQELAPKLGASVVLVHVYQLPVYSYPGLQPSLLPGFHAEVTQAARRALERRAGEAGDLRAELREGDPATEILAAIEQTRPTLVVMGTHGRGGLAHLFLGSVAERVVRASPVPVMTVRS